VERTNALPIQQFVERYVPTSSLELRISTRDGPSEKRDGLSISHRGGQAIDSGATFALDIRTAESLSDSDFQACFNLVELTSASDYINSSVGWSASKKKQEMRHPDMRYILMRMPQTSAEETTVACSQTVDHPSIDADEAPIRGYLSFMVTYEDRKEVIYCYEVHLSPALQGNGLGRWLMELLEEIGGRIGLKKVMLTVFKSNTIARRFYEKLGFRVDEYSPKPRLLRSGRMKEPDHLILSKKLQTSMPSTEVQ
jgi:N-alpha-acetyltransferase 40